MFHQMSVTPTLMAVCLGEPATTSRMVTHATVAPMVVTIVKSYQTSVLCIPISVPMVFATMTTTSGLPSACVTSPTVRVSSSPPKKKKKKSSFCGSLHTSSSQTENFTDSSKTHAILHTKS